jgi:hypothetical protein
MLGADAGSRERVECPMLKGGITMRKAISALVCITLLGLAASASAITLRIEHGSIDSFSLLRDTLFDFGGDGFSVSGALLASFLSYNPPNPDGSQDLPQTFNVAIAGGFPALVTVGSLVCVGEVEEPPCFGGLTLIHDDPITRPADWPVDTPFVATSPFTATGTLVFETGEEFDLVGQGTLTWTDDGSLLSAGYVFGVPEAPVLALLVPSLLGLAVHFHRIRSAARGRERTRVARLIADDGWSR